MEIIIASDHAGTELKEKIKAILRERGVSVTDLGTQTPEPVDYPDYAKQVASSVTRGEHDRGVLVCGTGIGMSIAANRLPGARATLCHDIYTAQMSREHNNSNILVLGGRVQLSDDLEDIVRTWLETEFLGGTHQERLDKIEERERGRGSSSSNPHSASRQV